MRGLWVDLFVTRGDFLDDLVKLFLGFGVELCIVLTMLLELSVFVLFAFLTWQYATRNRLFK